MSSLHDATDTDAFEHALGEAEMLIADIYTPSCVLCRKVEPMVAAAENSFAGRVRAVKVDAEANAALAAKYDVRGVPTLLLFKHGELADRKTGFVTAGALREWIKSKLGDSH